MKDTMLNKIKAAAKAFKGILEEIKLCYHKLPIRGKVILIIVLLICKFVLPDVVAFPVLLKWVRKYNAAKNKEATEN